VGGWSADFAPGRAVTTMDGLGSPPHAHAPLPDPRTPTTQPQDAQIRAAYGNFLRGMRRDIVRPFLMGAAAAFGMSLGLRCLHRLSTDRALLTRLCHAHRLRALGSVRPWRPNAGAAEPSRGAKAQGQREGLTGEGARALRKDSAAAPTIATVHLL